MGLGMCYGGVDLKHLVRETEGRLAGLPEVNTANGTLQTDSGIRALWQKHVVKFALGVKARLGKVGRA